MSILPFDGAERHLQFCLIQKNTVNPLFTVAVLNADKSKKKSVSHKDFITLTVTPKMATALNFYSLLDASSPRTAVEHFGAS